MKSSGNQTRNEYHKTDKMGHLHDLLISVWGIEEIIHNILQNYWIGSDRERAFHFTISKMR